MASRAAEIADELYGLAPDQFTAARDRAAAAARESGDRALAEQVKRFRRPTLAAWLVNQVARADDDQFGQLLDLGAALREAQDALDGAELRAMSRQRHEVIRGLSDLAHRIAGRPVGDSAQREFEATLEAALADDAAADAVRTGRLMRPLASSGLEPVNLSDAVAGPEPAPRRRRTRSGTASGTRSKPAPGTGSKPARRSGRESAPGTGRESAPDPGTERKRRAEIAGAEQRLADADQQVRAREQQAADARAAADEAHRRTTELEAALEAARGDQHDADRARRDAEAAVKAAARARDAAQRELGRLRRAGE